MMTTDARSWPTAPSVNSSVLTLPPNGHDGAFHATIAAGRVSDGLKTTLAGYIPGQCENRSSENLRASRETELAAEYPLHVVCSWIGNSALVAQKHYFKVTDADFERAAAQGGAESGARTAQNRAQHDARITSHHPAEVAETSGESAVSLENKPIPAEGKHARRDSNPQPSAPKADALSS